MSGFWCGSKARFGKSACHFRSTSISGPFLSLPARRNRANNRHLASRDVSYVAKGQPSVMPPSRLAARASLPMAVRLTLMQVKALGSSADTLFAFCSRISTMEPSHASSFSQHSRQGPIPLASVLPLLRPTQGHDHEVDPTGNVSRARQDHL